VQPDQRICGGMTPSVAYARALSHISAITALSFARSG
jgi:hypothetical protein